MTPFKIPSLGEGVIGENPIYPTIRPCLYRRKVRLLICNQGMAVRIRLEALIGEYTVCGSGALCKSVVNDSAGSTPASPTNTNRVLSMGNQKHCTTPAKTCFFIYILH